MSNYIILISNILFTVTVFTFLFIMKRERDNKFQEFIDVDKTNRVICAAVKLKDGFIITGVRHLNDNAMHRTRVKLNISITEFEEGRAGFIDKYGNFLERDEAWLIACNANQIVRLVKSQIESDLNKKGTWLWSENLY